MNNRNMRLCGTDPVLNPLRLKWGAAEYSALDDGSNSAVYSSSEWFMKQSNEIVFEISAVKTSGSQTVIEGRCLVGPIKLGDTFSTVSRMTVQMIRQSYGHPIFDPVAQVEIRVDSISAYGRQIKFLSDVMTAALSVSGTGIENLKAGLVVS
jgi:hypothetical protein